MELPVRLVTDIAQATGLKPEQATKAAGTLLGALQVSAPPEIFARIQKVIPDTGMLIGQGAPPLGGRTGEMRAYVGDLGSDVGADRLAAQLGLVGLTRDQVRTTVDIFTRYLQDTLGIQPVEQLLAAVPGLKRLAS